MISAIIPATVFWASALLVFYHHVIYPVITRYLARYLRERRVALTVHRREVGDLAEGALATITMVIPAYNEEAFIRAKIENLAALDYPKDKLSVVIASDGSSDETVAVARQVLAKITTLNVCIKDFAVNRGKVAVLNDVASDLETDIIVFSDVSSCVKPDALHRIGNHFLNENIGVVSGIYTLENPIDEGERYYWNFQTALKRDETTIGAMMGAHGAFYAIRASLFERLEDDTINDDFFIPMRIVAKGYRTVYDTSIVIREMEETQKAQDFKRRMRLSAGAMQQVVRFRELINPKRPGVAFVFVSGKALRAFVPFLLAAMLVTAAYLATMGIAVYQLALSGLGVLIALGLLRYQDNLKAVPKSFHPLCYASAHHMAGLLGGILYLGDYKNGNGENLVEWVFARRESDVAGLGIGFMTPATRFGKRGFDILIASLTFIFFAILFPFLALAIKLDSPGPVFYRQLRIGGCTQTETKLFLLMKFRTMYDSAERKTGAVWAQKNDIRITRIGRFLRRSRLDELPQCLNVLKGDMSIVGPRPERPAFFAKLEREIPFYIERTYGLRPGITGLAQITTGYDESVDDVREKVLHDHVYATRLNRLSEWMRADISICFKTFVVMILGKGQ